MFSLAELIDHARGKSPYYRTLYNGLSASGLDLEDLPLTDGTDYWERAFKNWENVLTGPLEDGFVFRSSGSSGTRQKTTFQTRQETLDAALPLAGWLNSALRRGDRAANLLHFGGLYGAWQMAFAAIDQLEFPIVHLRIGGDFPPDKIVADILDFQVTVVNGLSFTVSKIANHIVSSGKSAPSVRLVLFAGERISEDVVMRWKAAFPNAIVGPSSHGSVDTGFIGFPTRLPQTMEESTNPPYKAPNNFIVELIDDDGQVIRSPGLPGNIHVTSLDRGLQPILRYPIGDVAEWVDYDQALYRLTGRGLSTVKIEGVIVEMEHLKKTLSQQLKSDVQGRFQAVVRRANETSSLTLRLALAPPSSDGNIQLLEYLNDYLTSRYPLWKEHRQSGVIAPVSVEWVELNDLVALPSSGKLREIIDER